MTRYTFSSIVAAVALTLSSAAFAQQYPTKTVKIVSPAPPGGSTDIVARLIQPGLQELGQPVIVENKGGAGGYLGSEQVAKSPADGYTLLIGGAFSTITATLQKNPSYDPKKDLVPVGIFATVPNALVAGPKLKANSVADLIAEAKANPGKLNMGSNGVGTTLHLSGELFRIRTGTNIIHIAYRGWADAVNSVTAGETDFMFDNLSTALPNMQAGKTRILAVAAPERHRSAPNVPTLAELGVKDAEVMSWFGIMVPAGTPRAVIDTLDKQFRVMAARPAFQKVINDQGMDAVYIGADKSPAFWNAEIEKWASVIKAAGIVHQ
jgi:tripartite-type tricarboxylate transporter receptor subunit TctC